MMFFPQFFLGKKKDGEEEEEKEKQKTDVFS